MIRLLEVDCSQQQWAHPSGMIPQPRRIRTLLDLIFLVGNLISINSTSVMPDASLVCMLKMPLGELPIRPMPRHPDMAPWPYTCGHRPHLCQIGGLPMLYKPRVFIIHQCHSTKCSQKAQLLYCFYWLSSNHAVKAEEVMPA